jgi:UDP-N-acetylglucosamine 2-epimerase
LAHVEAGERSFVRAMPEEINRVVADRLASIFFCVSKGAVANLAREGITENVHRVGDVMYDALLANVALARGKSKILADLALASKSYYLATVHRADNTSSRERLEGIFEGFARLDRPVVLPLHPRTAAAMEKLGVKAPSGVRLIEPVGYFDMLVLEENAIAIGTDSGGVQREAYCLGVPCVTVRDETEWTETVEAGWNRLAGTDPEAIRAAFEAAKPEEERPPIFGTGKAAEEIARILDESDLLR